MKFAEFEIVLPSGTKETQVLKFGDSVSRNTIVLTAKQMLRKCGWKKVRVSVGEYTSRWKY